MKPNISIELQILLIKIAIKKIHNMLIDFYKNFLRFSNIFRKYIIIKTLYLIIFNIMMMNNWSINGDVCHP